LLNMALMLLSSIYNSRMCERASRAMLLNSTGCAVEQHSGQVLTLEGQTCSHFRAFTS
jgi:hypothetical protein